MSFTTNLTCTSLTNGLTAVPALPGCVVTIGLFRNESTLASLQKCCAMAGGSAVMTYGGSQTATGAYDDCFAYCNITNEQISTANQCLLSKIDRGGCTNRTTISVSAGDRVVAAEVTAKRWWGALVLATAVGSAFSIGV